MKKSALICNLFLMILITVNSCSKSSSDQPRQVFTCNSSISFSSNIKRILDVNCNPCHGPGSGYSQALAKWTYDGSFSNAYNNRVQINSMIAAGLMPQSGALPQAAKDSVNCWVNQGAPN